MITFLANPQRFMTLSRWLAPTLGVIALALACAGLDMGLNAPPDYQQGPTVLIMFVHVPAAWLGMFAYGCLAGSAFFGLVFRHSLADAAAKAAAPLGAGFTLLALATGSLWGKPEWGTWWEWDARMTSVLVLLLLYLGYMALQAAHDDEAKATRNSSILAMVGIVNLPIIKFSVYWWNSLHQGSSIFAKNSEGLAAVYRPALYVMILAYLALFGALWLVRIRAEVWRRRAGAAALAAAAG